MKVKRFASCVKSSPTFRKTAWLCSGAMLVSFLAPLTAKGQLGIGTAAILAFLESMNTAMQTTMAVPLAAIQGIEQQESTFQQATVYPTSDIQSVQSLSSSFTPQMAQMQSAMSTPAPTANPGTPEMTLETSALSGDPSVIPNIPTEYSQVYGPTPTTTTFANPQELSAVDMGDAEAKDALAEAVKLDAISQKEMTIASQLMAEAPNSTPGTAAMIEAQASAWILQADAYSQAAMSQLLRVRSAALSYQGLDIKSSGIAGQNSSQAIQNVIASH